MTVNKKSNQIRTKTISLLVVATSAVINPWTSYDPINAPKFFLLVCTAAISTILCFSYRSVWSLKSFFRPSSLLIILFFAHSVLVLIFADTPFWFQIYGTWGRNTGFLFFVSSVIILISISFISKESDLPQWSSIFYRFGIFSLGYGFIQALGLDPIPWTNKYSNVIGFFGNPNFMSAFLGFLSTHLWVNIFSSNQISLKFLQNLFLNAVSFWVILKTDSTQGIILFFLGLFYSILLWIYPRRKKAFVITFVTGLGIGFLGLLDVMQQGFWRSFLYQPSVSERGDLWRASFGIIRDFPIWGVGFDGFGFFYREYRDAVAYSLRGANTVGNSVHNVVLDAFVNGGLILGFLYIGFLIATSLAAIKVFKSIGTTNVNFNCFVGIWLCFNLQSFISMNQIGIAIWGWVSAGIIFSVYKSTYVNVSNLRPAEFVQSKYLSNLKRSSFALFLVTSVIIAGGPLRADIQYSSAIKSREIVKVRNAALQFPRNPEFMWTISELFRQNNLFDISYEISIKGAREFPRYFQLWKSISTLPNTPETVKEEAERVLKSLDPNEVP